MDDFIVRDSSLNINKYCGSLTNDGDYAVRIGTIRDRRPIVDPKKPDEFSMGYFVEVMDSQSIGCPVFCVPTFKFGGVYNYEEYVSRGFTPGTVKSSETDVQAKVGDKVIVAYIRGNATSGVILGFLKHEARKPVLQKQKLGTDIAYRSEFNGIETFIDEKGQYKQVFKGQPTNLADLNKAVDSTLAKPAVYDYKKGGSYYKWELDGSYELSDNSGVTSYTDPFKEGDAFASKADTVSQLIRLDKAKGQILVQSGNTKLTINKKAESYSIVNKITDIKSATSFTLKTKTTLIDTTTSFEVNTAKTYVHGGPIEMNSGSAIMTLKNGKIKIQGATDELLNLFSETLGVLARTTAAGYGAPIDTVADFAQLKVRLNNIKG